MLDLSTIDNLASFILQAGHRFDNKPALIWRPDFRARRLSYRDLLQMSKAVAHILEEQKIARGERVILWAANSPYWLAIFFGCQLKGVVPVPVAPQNTTGFVQKIADFTNARMVFKNHALPELTGVRGAQIEIIFGNWRDRSTAYHPATINQNDIAELLFTSGTTGEPKGVMLKHSNILANITSIRKLNLVNERDHMLSFLPLSHIFEQVAGILVPLSVGIPITQAARISGPHITLNMQEDHPTKMTAVPEFIKVVLERIEDKARLSGQFHKLKKLYRLAPRLPFGLRRLAAKKIIKNFGGRLTTIIAGGAALDPKVGAKWESFGIYVLQGYGATETSPVVAVNSYQGRTMDSVGKVIPGVQVRIASDGEILVKGASVVPGYFHNDKATARAFKNGWYHTDDLGYFDQKNNLHIKGRKKYLIVTPAGQNVYPEELENRLKNYPDVADAAVIGSKIAGQFGIRAVVLPKSGATPNTEQIFNVFNRQVEPHQRLQQVLIWPRTDFPRTLTKKIKKDRVLNWLENEIRGSEKNTTTARPDPLPAIISDVAQVPVDQITPDKTLVGDLGLDSLKRLSLVASIEEKLGIVLDESQINETTTVAKIKLKINKKDQKKEIYVFKEWPLKRTVLVLREILQRVLAWPFILIISKLEIEGLENLSKIKPPAQFFINHISGIDAGFVVRALPSRFRRKSSIAAASDLLFERPDIKKWIHLLTLFFNVFPFSRYGQIKSSFEYAGRLIDRGFSILYHPEGKITRNHKIQKFKEGTGLIATQMRVPAVPVYIVGSDKLSPPGTKKLRWGLRPHIKVIFGEPVFPKTDDSVRAVTNHIEKAIIDLALRNGDKQYVERPGTPE